MLKPGAVIAIPANVKLRHDAVVNSWFSRIAAETTGENAKTEWCDL